MEGFHLNQQQKNELPKTIKINWRTYKILKKETLQGGDDYVGNVFQSSGEIEIKKDQEFYAEKITVLHEIIHCILYHAGSKLKKDEDFIEMVANGIYQVLKENPEVVRWIVNEDEKIH